MFSTREVPWQKVGITIDQPVNAADAIALAGLDFEVLPQPAGYLRDATWHTAPNRVALVRQDTEEVYAYATEGYEPIQYREAFDFADVINPKYVSAGALRGGREGFLVIELPSKYAIMLRLKDKVDSHQLYVLLRTSQDLTHGIEIAIMSLRYVCMNMLTLPGMTKSAKQRWAIRHTRNARVKLQQAQDVIMTVDKYAHEFECIAQQLASIDMTCYQQKDLLEEILPDKPKKDEQILGILTALDLDTNVDFANTGWGLVNAVVEYFEYLRIERGRTDESRFTDGLQGSAHKYGRQVMQSILMQYA